MSKFDSWLMDAAKKSCLLISVLVPDRSFNEIMTVGKRAISDKQELYLVPPTALQYNALFNFNS